MFEGNVLVLNKSWAAVHIASARRAMTLLYVGAARAVHPNHYSLHDFEDWVEPVADGLGGRYMHTPNLRIRVPEVILLTLFNGFIHHEVRFSRQESIFERDKGTCQYYRGNGFPLATHDRSRDAAVARRRRVGEPGACVPALQRAQGQPYARRGEYAAADPSV